MRESKSQSNTPTKAVLVWALATLFYLYENLLQVSQGVMVPELMRAFHLSAQQLSSQLGATFLLAYSIAQFPIGILLDRYSTRLLLTVASGLCTISCYVYANAQVSSWAVASRFCMGIGAAFAALSCLKLASGWFQHRQFALLTGLMLSIGLSGSILGEAPLLQLVNSYGWRASLVMVAHVGACITLLIALGVHDNPHYVKERSNRQQLLSSLKQLLQKKSIWAIALYGMFMFAPFLIFSNLWGPIFIEKTYHLSRETATVAFEMIFLGFIIGAPFFGWYSDYSQRRKRPLYIGAIGALAIMSSILYVVIPHPVYISILMLLLGFFTSAFLPAFSIMKEMNPTDMTTSALGFMNTLNSLGGPILIAATGFLLDTLWDGTLVNGIRVYDSAQFISAFSLLPLLYLLAILLLSTIEETHCTQQQSQPYV